MKPRFCIWSILTITHAQVLEEWSETGQTPNVTYTIGDDVITQADSAGIHHIIYDGHGSTRQLTDHPATGLASATDNYSYDAYGVLLQPDAAASQKPGFTPKQTTNLLYAGEYFDANAQHYYNRARWYNPLNGRFNRTDPYAGSPHDPQSLHKYLYCHANPVNMADPSGNLSVLKTVAITSIVLTLCATLIPIGGGIIVAYRAGVSPSEFWREFTSWETWAEALIAIGFGALTTASVKWIALKLGIRAFSMFGLIMSVYSVIKSAELTKGMLTGQFRDEDIAHFLAVMTATIVLTVAVGFVLTKYNQYYSETKRAQARGRQNQTQVLKEMGLDENRARVITHEGASVPDSLTDNLIVEVKDRKNVSLTRQLRIQTQGANGRNTVLVTGMFTDVSGPAQRAFHTVVRRPDLGPHTEIIVLQMVKSVALNKLFWEFEEDY